MDYKLLCAKDAIFKMLGQFLYAVKLDDGELYLLNYCESALEAAFDVLGIEENHIKVSDFCKMWEENSRRLWELTTTSESFNGITAEMHYQVFKSDYDNRSSYIDGY